MATKCGGSLHNLGYNFVNVVSLQIYIGVTDHLWGKHCQREFKDSRLLEYESWKEMYIRLSEEREIKLQRLTKSIVSAHSNKPKGALAEIVKQCILLFCIHGI